MHPRMISRASVRPTVFILSVAALCATAAAYVLPSADYDLAAALRDGDLENALSQLERRDPGAKDNQDLRQKVQLYLHFGELEKAIKICEQMVAENARDLWGLETLARLYRDTGQQREYLQTLHRRLDASPSPTAFLELIGHYRLVGDARLELQTFEQGRRLGLATQRDIALAGTQYSAQGDLTKAADLFALLDLRSSPDLDYVVVLTWLDVLKRLSRPEQAYALAERIRRIRAFGITDQDLKAVLGSVQPKEPSILKQ